jgi:hypothetical protein
VLCFFGRSSVFGRPRCYCALPSISASSAAFAAAREGCCCCCTNAKARACAAASNLDCRNLHIKIYRRSRLCLLTRPSTCGCTEVRFCWLQEHGAMLLPPLLLLRCVAFAAALQARVCDWQLTFSSGPLLPLIRLPGRAPSVALGLTRCCAAN